jgi:hypothetical protein
MKHMMVSYSGGVVAHEIEDLWSESFDLGGAYEFWSGSHADGTMTNERCKDWTSMEGYGVVGSRTLSESESPCSEYKKILCICKTKI